MGKVVEFLDTTGANDVCVIRSLNGKELLIPVIDEVFGEIDLLKGEIHVRLLPGLLP